MRQDKIKQPAENPGDQRAREIAGELRVLLGKFGRRLRQEASLGDFTRSQLNVVGLLEREGPATVTSLARAEGVRPQSMGETLAVLKAAGLVTGTADPTDGRQTVLSLTAACREALRTARAARQDWLFRALRETLAESEREELAATIELLKRLLDA
jgi:DNA-binding MarR family transcriptional regulator